MYTVHCCCLVPRSCLTVYNPMDYSPQALLSTGFPGQEQWNGLPFPSLIQCMGDIIDASSSSCLQRIFVFLVQKLQCWRRLLRGFQTVRRSNQSVLKEINPDYSLEGLMLKLQLQYFGHLMQRADSLEKTLMLGKIEGRRRSRGQRLRWLVAPPTQWTGICANSGRQWRTGKPSVLQSMGLQSQTQPSS